MVEAFLRKGKGAIGRYGPEGSRPKVNKADSEDEEEQEFKAGQSDFSNNLKKKQKKIE